MPDEPHILSVVTIKQMSDLLDISKSRLYQLLDKNILLKPVYLLSNRCPYFTHEMAKTNLKVKENGVGINGEVVLFYAKRNRVRDIPVKGKARQRKPKMKTDKSNHDDLKDTLESLGLTDLTDPKINSALADCFPDGTKDIDEGEVITTIFRHLKQNNSTDNVGR